MERAREDRRRQACLDGRGGARPYAAGAGGIISLALGNAVVFTAGTAQVRPGLLSGMVGDRHLRVAGLAGGTASYVAYALVVWAFTEAPIALATALREVWIVFASIIGTVWLRERLDVAKLASTTITVCGAMMLRFARH